MSENVSNAPVDEPMVCEADPPGLVPDDDDDNDEMLSAIRLFLFCEANVTPPFSLYDEEDEVRELPTEHFTITYDDTSGLRNVSAQDDGPMEVEEEAAEQ